MAVKQIRKPEKDRLYSIRARAFMIARSSSLAAAVLAAALSALANGQRDVYMKRLYILKILSSLSPFDKRVR